MSTVSLFNLLSASSSVITLVLLTFLTSLIFYLTRKTRGLKQRLVKAEEEKEKEIRLAIINAREEERNKIATNLHDTVGAELSLLKLKLTRYGYFLKNNLFIKSESFISDVNEIDYAIENVKAVCRDLYPETIRKRGLLCALRYYVKRLNGCGGVNFHFNCSVNECQLRLDEESKKNLFRLFQESMNNILKHANCSRLCVCIKLNQESDKLEIHLKHNGIKFNNHDANRAVQSGKGLGLISINQRVRSLNAYLDYTEMAEKPCVSIFVPIRGLRILKSEQKPAAISANLSLSGNFKQRRSPQRRKNPLSAKRVS